jgi:hypothetical protein
VYTSILFTQQCNKKDTKFIFLRLGYKVGFVSIEIVVRWYLNSNNATMKNDVVYNELI